MKISATAVSLAFFAKTSSAFTLPSTSISVGAKTVSISPHPIACPCSFCAGTALFADVAEEVPAEVEAMDGIESNEEEHNAERPQRQQLKKKRKGKDLSEFEVGSMVSGTVKSIASYGAFVDIGASTDGLLHISQLASGYVANVGEIVSEGQEVEVRIISIDSGKGQVALSLMSEDEASAQPQRRQRQSNRRDDGAVLSALSEKGWETTKFVEGTVVSTVDFGAFVKVDAKTLNEECEGEFDGLVHISAIAVGRVNSVSDIVNPNEKVQVRCKSIQGGKVSLTMLTVEDEESKADSFNAGREPEGAKDWAESQEKLAESMPVFKNGPVVVDRRNQ